MNAKLPCLLYYSEALSNQNYHWVLGRIQHHMDMLTSDKKNVKLWGKRLHIAIQVSLSHRFVLAAVVILSWLFSPDTPNIRFISPFNLFASTLIQFSIIRCVFFPTVYPLFTLLRALYPCAVEQRFYGRIWTNVIGHTLYESNWMGHTLLSSTSVRPTNQTIDVQGITSQLNWIAEITGRRCEIFIQNDRKQYLLCARIPWNGAACFSQL